MDFLYFSDDARLNPFVRQPGTFTCVSLVAHLRGDVLFCSGHRQLPGLVNGMRQWLFAVDVFAPSDGVHRHHGMNMVGGSHADCVDFFSSLSNILRKSL